MGNLGGYQLVTTVIKALGGPVKAAVVILGGTFAAGGLTVAGGQQGYKVIYKSIKKRRARKEPCPTKGQSFAVHAAGIDEQGIEFSVGDVYIVLECDRDAILIELTDNDNNPYFVSAAFIASISDYPAPPESTNDEDETSRPS